MIGLLVVAFAGLALLRFCSGLRARFARDDEPTSPLTTTMVTASAVFTALLFVGSAAIAAVSAGVEFGDNPVPTDADLIRSIESIGYGAILGFGGIVAALLVLATSLASRAGGVFPGWLRVVGYVAAGILLLDVMYLPMAALPLWVGLVSIWGLRDAPAT